MMRPQLLLVTTLLAGASFGQCDFDPVITPDVIPWLCPGDDVTLMTGIYDSYQWYRDGEQILGATDPSFTVDYMNSGAPYSVEVTDEGCTEMSPVVWVDGWIFLPPFVIHGGDLPIGTGPNGEVTFCEGQTLTLEMSSTYSNNIVWTNNGVVIPDEDSTVLMITESGSYSGSGSPAECPNYSASLGVEVVVEFLEPQQPQIQENDDELCAFPLGTSYTWYLNGVELEGDTVACITASGGGSYTVFVDYGQDCQIISEPYLITGLLDATTDKPWSIYPNPGAGTVNILMDPAIGTDAYYSISDILGQEVAAGWVPLNGFLHLELQELGAGTYFFQAAKAGRALAPATRFNLVK